MKNKWMGIVITGWLLTAPAWAGIYYAAVTESEGGGTSPALLRRPGLIPLPCERPPQPFSYHCIENTVPAGRRNIQFTLWPSSLEKG